LLLLVGCFSPGYTDATRCGAAPDECPPGRSCVGGFCVAAGAAAVDAPTPIDGPAPIDDAPTIDGPSTIDAPSIVTITVTKNGIGEGSVTGDKGGLACPRGCTTITANVARNTTVSLTATPVLGARFAGYGPGSCLGIARTCTFVATEDVTVEATFVSLDRNLIFVTSDTFTGALGGLDGADHACQVAASAAGLRSSDFVALLSTPTVQVGTRLSTGTGLARGFIRMDGQPVADTVADLIVDHRILHPVVYDENGNAVADLVWTGTSAVGTGAPQNCGSWSVTNDDGEAGRSNGAAVFASGIRGCNFAYHLYCASHSFAAPLPVQQAEGKLIWLSKGQIAGSDGLDAANTLCHDERPNGVADAAALLATIAAPAANLVADDARYVRPDGVFVGTGADLKRGTLQTGIWVHVDKTYEELGPIHTGSFGFAMPARNYANDCSDWTMGTETAIGIGGAMTVDASWWFGGPLSCNDGWVYCVEK
jgi:hypothetical protein